MAGNVGNQIWLTSVINNEEVAKALTLRISLKRVLTTRNVGVIVSSNVGYTYRKVLRYNFDYLFYLENDDNAAKINDDQFAKVSALTLTCFEKLVYLAPESLAIANPDDLFQHSLGPGQIIPIDARDFSVFVIQPSLQTFEVLMEELRERNGKSFPEYLNTWCKNQTGFNAVIEKCSRVFTPKTDGFIGLRTDAAIAKLDSIHFDNSTKNLGLLAKLVVNRWKTIYEEDVKPILEAAVNTLPAWVTSNPVTHSFANEPIAIIGMSCRYPNANNLEAFWNLLSNGLDGTGTPPSFRWLRHHSPRNVAAYRETNAGFLRYPVEDFDSKFFGISPKEMVFLDPQHRLLHEIVWEGLEDAAIDPQSLEGTNGGVFIGSWLNEYKEILTFSGYDEFYRMYMGTGIGAGAARISHLLGLTGPCVATESGCSSAMVAVHLACKSLQRGETNLALACGVNLLLHPFDKDIMPMVVSPDGHSKTFDANADGYGRAEGCGVLILKRFSEAVRDGDKIWAMIKGSAMTQEGISKSMGTPTIHCESLAMKQALHDARVTPESVSYVEAHGTGTMVGDPLEISAIAKAYHSKARTKPLYIGSVKTNVGHTESCSGITGIMKVVLSMKNETIPPHINFKTLNPSINLDTIPAIIPIESVGWKKECGHSRFAGVSSFGVTGTDAHVILEEAPSFQNKALTMADSFDRPLHIMKISAKTSDALDILVQNYKNFFCTTEEEFKHLAYTANVGRADFSLRAVIVAKSNATAMEVIENKEILLGEESKLNSDKICFLFTGQGSQYNGMARELYKTSPVFRIHFEYCENILRNQYNIDIVNVLWSDQTKELSRTIFSQTSIFCVEYALLKLWESWGVSPDYVLGHSLGEFAASVCAGILSVDDALKLVTERSQLIENLSPGKMLVIKQGKPSVVALMKEFAGGDLKNFLELAAINSKDQTVVAGNCELILSFANFCNKKNIKCIILEATHAFHSKHMDPILDDYRKVAQTTSQLKSNSGITFISGMRGAVVDSFEIDAEYWVQHTKEKVLFMNSCKKAVELGCKIFIEVGPQPVLSVLTQINNEDTNLMCLPSLKRTENEWETLFTSLGKMYLKGVQINWKGVDELYSRKKVRLPHYPFLGKKYWPNVRTTNCVAIHPLLGSIMPNASSAKVFQSNLSLHGLEYINDHRIGDTVVFPGAGYLEMCLAAGLATIECCTDSLSLPTRAMKVENLSIEAPLSLNESTPAQIQTIVKLSNKEGERDWGELSIKIFRQAQSDSSKWQSHAAAKFSALPLPLETEVLFNLNEFLQTLEREPEDGKLLEQMYEKLASVGLKFGPTFKSIEKVWRDDVTDTLLAKIKITSLEVAQPKYILHPVVLDAMIQAIIMRRPISKLKKTLYVPIKIGKFVWISGTEDSSFNIYVHSYKCDSYESALLVDETGKVLAVMSSVELIETTVKAVESILEQQISSMPDCWEEVWRKAPSSIEHSADMERARGKYFTAEFHKRFDAQHNILSDCMKETFGNLEKLVYLNLLRGMYETGWAPGEINTTFSETSVFHQLDIMPAFRKYFGFICDVLQTEGVLAKVKKVDTFNYEMEWKVVQKPPAYQEVVEMLSIPKFSSELVQIFEPTLLLQVVGENLSSVLKGTRSAISVLFPEGEKKYPSISEFYDKYGEFNGAANLEQVGELAIKHVVNSQLDSGCVFRVLEIGAGTGACTEKAINILAGMDTKFEYTYTDISASFFPAAEKRFEKYLKSIRFKKLNIEEDPIAQGFVPQYFDYVLAGEVIHATKDVRGSLRYIYMLMKPSARLNIQETTRVNRIHAFSFGLLEGYWRFQDFDLRQRYCVLDKTEWTNVLSEIGFEVEGIFSVSSNDSSLFMCIKTQMEPGSKKDRLGQHTWLLFCQPNQDQQLYNYLQQKIEEVIGRNVIIVSDGNAFVVGTDNQRSFSVRKGVYDDFVELLRTIKSRRVNIEGIVYCWALDNQITEQEDILKPYFYLTKSLLTLNIAPRLSLITKGLVPLRDWDMSQFHKSTLWGYNKSMKSENFHLRSKSIDISDGVLNSKRIEEIFYEIWNSDKETQVALHEGSRYIPRLQRHIVRNEPLKLPQGTDRYQLVLPETKSITDLQFGPISITDLKDDEIEIQLKASALNFRDLLSIIKPSQDFKDSNTVGFDFAGVIKRVGEKVTKWKVSERVYGLNVRFTAMPSHLVLPQEFVLPLPDHLSFCEGATMPAVYITSMLCLLDIAKITKDDMVLIHSASGGVGLSAIEICKHIGCRIVVTAGSKRKRNYLSSLGIKHIFHSRNTEYGEKILELTNGRGVDVVLNSLTSQGFKEATLKACANGARFVEMSKLNIWREEDVRQLRPDVKYTAIDLTQSSRQEWIRLLNGLDSPFGRNFVKPMPYTRFNALNIRQALEYLQNAKHIGKIVCTLPELKSESGELSTYTPMFNEQGSYLITGGLGGIGFVVAEWMVAKGAKYIVLAGRRHPNELIQSKINDMNSRGAKLITMKLDIGKFEECSNFINKQLPTMGLPPLKGIMHAAGILSDGLILSQDWDKLRATFDTKINGTLNLHHLTKHLSLEHFVLFSSVVALFGTSGQANHAAANAFEDALVHYRNSIGLPATSINWGQWGEVGIAKEIDLAGIKVLSNLQGITGLEYVMNTHRPQTAIVNVESFVLLSKILPQLPTYLDELVWKKASSSTNCVTIKSDDFWKQYDSINEDQEKVELLKSVLGIILRKILKLDERDNIDYNSNLQEMGVDSLMFVEIKNVIQQLMGERLVVNTSSIKDCNTIAQLASTLERLIEGEEDNEKPSVDQVNQLIQEDCCLPDHITAKENQTKLPLSDVKTVLVTGCTGTFGPYVLMKLVELSQISKIICLIRPRRNENPDERLRSILVRHNLRVNLGKVMCIAGNVAETRLGMDSNLWDQLAQTVDAVIHCAAKVDHNEVYKKRESQRDTRAVNIRGTKNILEFACEKQLKHVFYTSTLVVVTSLDNGRVSERWPEMGEFDGRMALAYPISKFVGDMLMKQAVQRGIPCKVFRLPYIAGESETGRCSMENNHILLRYMFIMKNGIMPSSVVPLILLPVDIIAEATLLIFFEEKAESGIYNIAHGSPASDQEFANIAEKFGYKINFVELSEFAKLVQNSGGALEILKHFYRDDNEIMEMFSGASILQKWLEGGGKSNDLWFSEKVAKIIPNFYQNQRETMEYVYKDIKFCKSQGWFEKFGL